MQSSKGLDNLVAFPLHIEDSATASPSNFRISDFETLVLFLEQ